MSGVVGYGVGLGKVAVTHATGNGVFGISDRGGGGGDGQRTVRLGRA